MNHHGPSLRQFIAFLAAALLASSTLYISSHAATSTDQPSRSPGCALDAGQSGLIKAQIRVRDRVRTYLLQVPTGYQPSRAYPLVFVFHAAGGSASQAYSWGLQRAAGAADGAVFVFPDAIPFRQEGIGWDDDPDGRDLPFFDAMIKDVEAARCIDTHRVFVAGFSWGGDFAVALACHRGDLIRAVAANSTDDEYRDATNYLTYRGLPCRAHQHPSVRFTHAQGGDPEYPAPDFATTSKLFQYLNSCTGGAIPTNSSTDTMSCAVFKSCSSSYTECIFDAHLGHSLPPNWAEDTWAFFADTQPVNPAAAAPLDASPRS